MSSETSPPAIDIQQQQQPPAGGSTAAAAAAAVPATSAASMPAMDFASILAKIQSLEKEKADMRAQLENVTGKLSRLQESKRAEMEQMMNSTISKWLENLETKDAAAKQQLKDGLNRLVQQGDESGVWNVIACASSSWIHNVNQIETLTQQLNEYKEKERLLSGGIFQAEESRVSAAPGQKRSFDDMNTLTHGAHTFSTMAQRSDENIWDDFQSMMMSSGGNRGGVEQYLRCLPREPAVPPPQ